MWCDIKSRFFLTLISLIFSLATFAQRTATIQGMITGLESGTVYLKKTDNATTRPVYLDTTTVSNGRFEFSRMVSESDFYSVLVEGLPGQVQFFWDEDVTIEGTKDLFRESIVKGSPLTAEWNTFQSAVEFPYRDILMDLYNERHRSATDTAVINRVAREEKRLRQEQYQKIQQLIRDKPNSLLSLYLLNWYWMHFPKAEARALYEKLDISFKSHSVAKRLQNQLN